jgi:hypothetical protein
MDFVNFNMNNEMNQFQTEIIHSNFQTCFTHYICDIVISKKLKTMNLFYRYNNNGDLNCIV